MWVMIWFPWKVIQIKPLKRYNGISVCEISVSNTTKSVWMVSGFTWVQRLLILKCLHLKNKIYFFVVGLNETFPLFLVFTKEISSDVQPMLKYKTGFQHKNLGYVTWVSVQLGQNILNWDILDYECWMCTLK